MSLRNVQQVDKLLVGEILPRTATNEYLSSGLILLTDDNGKANWTATGSLARSFSQFTQVSTNKGKIPAGNLNTSLNLIEAGGISLDIDGKDLYIQNTGIIGIDVSGSNILYGSNVFTNKVNPLVKFIAGKNTRLRSNPEDNTVQIDVDLVVSSFGPRYAFTDIGFYKSEQTFSDVESFVRSRPPNRAFHAPDGESRFNIVSFGDELKVEGIDVRGTPTFVFSLSSITSQKFDQIYNIVTNEFPRLEQLVNFLNIRTTSQSGTVIFQDLYPLSTGIGLNRQNISLLSSAVRDINLRQTWSIGSLSTSWIGASNISTGILTADSAFVSRLAVSAATISTASFGSLTGLSTLTDTARISSATISTASFGSLTGLSTLTDTARISSATISTASFGFIRAFSTIVDSLLVSSSAISTLASGTLSTSLLETSSIRARNYTMGNGEEFRIKYVMSSILFSSANPAATPLTPNIFYNLSGSGETNRNFSVFVGDTTTQWANGDWVGLAVRPSENNTYRFSTYFNSQDIWLDPKVLLPGQAAILIHSSGSWSHCSAP